MKDFAICGSMRFYPEMKALAQTFAERGKSSYLPEAEEIDAWAKAETEVDRNILKRRYIDTHLEKIRNSRSVLIANYSKHGIDGYVGPNTLMEIAFAYALGKKIILLHPLGEQACREEVEALGAMVLGGDLSGLVP